MAAEHIAIEHWWPQLIAASKHRIQRDLDAPLADEIVRQIEAIVGRDIDGEGWVLTEWEKDFIRTQGEPVD
ncbi:hypothetical protein EV379_3407 [Microterricola gilva]|uniref:Uncharacterized protein n=1 Tax=Microterricola gilva TaxID=393267 RepID=A0A4Q8AQM4_9MICO|nr:hypothetical protein [Microterricola gilva]RZU67032.1 hypothetical protein EV379_3407 [Microterricola gilva]